MPADSDESDSDVSAAGDSFLELDEDDLSPEDEAALHAFMAPNLESYQQQTLGDIILAKIKEKQMRNELESIHG